MTRYLCDRCATAESAPASRFERGGIVHIVEREYVICGELGRMWVREKKREGERCWGFRERRGS